MSRVNIMLVYYPCVNMLIWAFKSKCGLFSFWFNLAIDTSLPKELHQFVTSKWNLCETKINCTHGLLAQKATYVSTWKNEKNLNEWMKEQFCQLHPHTVKMRHVDLHIKWEHPIRNYNGMWILSACDWSVDIINTSQVLTCQLLLS